MRFPQNFDFQPADYEGAKYIFERPRDTELELARYVGMTPDADFLARKILETEATIVRIDQEPAAIWFWYRLNDLQIEVGVWATELMLRHPVAFTRGAIGFIRGLRMRFPEDQILTVVTLGPHTTRFWLRVIGFRDTGEIDERPGGPVEYMAAR